METLDIRRKLHQFIDSMEDKKAAAIYTLLEGEIDTDAQRKRLVLAEREQYLRGDGSSYTWDDVKEMALHKEKRHAL